ncbi:MAG: DUF3179 domain-containing (seleno)protein [Myxococcota bacterium]
MLRRTGMIAGLAVACTPEVPTGVAPSNPGVGIVESITYEGAPFVPDAQELAFTDEGTGSRFNLAGQAFDGPLADSNVQLAVLPAIAGFWFAWSTHYPDARIWNVDHMGDPLQSTEGCGVPCNEIALACSGRDCIPSIDRPVWRTADDSGNLGYLTNDDRVLGIARGAAARAYPLDTLWTHEIVNDTWGDWSFSVTYCPLTGTGVLVDGVQEGQEMEFGVSGNLYNSNLVMYDRTTDTLYGQMRLVGFAGERLGAPLAAAGLVDTTWGEWRRMYPQTEVLDERHASPYPYGDFREDDTDTFRQTRPAPEPFYPNKDYVIGLSAGGETVIWAYPELQAALGDRGVLEDVVGDLPVLVAYDAAGPTAVVFSRLHDGEVLSFTSEAAPE